MTSSSASNPKPQVIRVPRAQVTPDPKPGYRTADFWRDLEARMKRSAGEFDRFQRMVGQPHRKRNP